MFSRLLGGFGVFHCLKARIPNILHKKGFLYHHILCANYPDAVFLYRGGR